MAPTKDQGKKSHTSEKEEISTTNTVEEPRPKRKTLVLPKFTDADLPQNRQRRLQGRGPNNNVHHQLDPAQFKGTNWHCLSAYQENGGQYKSKQIS